MVSDRNERTVSVENVRFFFDPRSGIYRSMGRAKRAIGILSGRWSILRELLVLSTITALLFASTILWFARAPGNIENVGEYLDAPEYAAIENVTDGQYTRIFGRIAASEGNVLHYENGTNGTRILVHQNFSLERGNESILVITSNQTEVLQFEHGTPEDPRFVDGDLVYVIGTVNSTNGTRFITAERIMDKEIVLTGWEAFLFLGGILLTIVIVLPILGKLCIKLVKTILQTLKGSNFRKRENEHEDREADSLFVQKKNEEQRSYEKLFDHGIRGYNYHHYLMYPLFYGMIVAFLILWALSTILHLDDTKSIEEIGLSMILVGPLAFFAFLISVWNRYSFDTYGKIIVGNEGILLIKWMANPFFILWEDIKFIQVNYLFHIDLEDGRHIHSWFTPFFRKKLKMMVNENMRPVFEKRYGDTPWGREWIEDLLS